MTAKKHVFISYSRKNTDFIDRLVKDLESVGIPFWIDREGIDFGTDWQMRIRGGIRDAYALLLVASPDSAASRYVRDEIHIAEMYQCPVFLAWAAGENWADCAPFGYIGSQYADARDAAYPAGIARVIKSLKPENFQQIPSSTKVSPPTNGKFNPRNPYKGLRAFTAQDKEDYFGRDMLIPELAAALNPARFLAVMGPSGSGKSSVVMAGLLPYLQADNNNNWLYFDPILPGVEPLKALAYVLANASGEDSSHILEDLKENIRELHKIIRRLARNHEKAVIFVDQFEELFTQTAHESERRQFIDLLTTAVNEPEGKTTIVITLRADFYDRPMNYEHLGKLIENHSKSLLPMTLEELRRVIELPAQKEKMTFETGLVGDLLFEVSGQTGALPLLQFTLYQLFEQRKEQLLTTAAYRQLGGVRGALRRHAEKTYADLPSDEHRKMARALFLRLIEPGATEQDTTRRRARRSELQLADESQTQILRETAEAFIHARLVMADKDTIEVSHEALIREWQLLANWLQTAREDVYLQQMISRDAEEWIRKGKRDDDLYRGAKLAEAQAWAERNIVSYEEMVFIEKSSEIDLIYQTMLKVPTISDLDTLLEIVNQATKSDDCVIFLNDILVAENLIYHKSVNRKWLIQSENPVQETRHLAQELGRWFLQILDEIGDAIIIQDLHTQDYPYLSSKFEEIRSALIVFMKTDEDPLGILMLLSVEPNKYTDIHSQLLATTAVQITTSMNSADLYQLIRDQAERLGMLLRVEQEESQKNAAILEAITDGVIFIDTSEKIVLYNAAAERMSGISREKVLNQSLIILRDTLGKNADLIFETIQKWSQIEQRPENIHPIISNTNFARVYTSPVFAGDRHLGIVMILHENRGEK